MPKTFFNGAFAASDLRKSTPKAEVQKPVVKVTIVKRDDKTEVEKQLDTLLETLLASGQKEKAYMIQQIYEKSNDFSVDLINKINGKDHTNQMSATDATGKFFFKSQYTMLQKLSKCEVKA